jgi:hypothetical protein
LAYTQQSDIDGGDVGSGVEERRENVRKIADLKEVDVTLDIVPHI